MGYGARRDGWQSIGDGIILSIMPSASETPLLRLRGVQRTHLGPVDLDLDAGECVVIMGASGAGKSLLLRQIGDLDPGTGSLFLQGVPRDKIPATQWRRKVMYCQAEPGWWDDFVAPHFAGHGKKTADLAERFDLPASVLQAAVHTLSTGERQRLGLIRALVREPSILLLDEPTGALDANTTAKVEEELKSRLASGTAIVLVTHQADQARRLGNRAFRLENGTLNPLWE
jgi:ABC-type iron transport system FetAB ATPase subunit